MRMVRRGGRPNTLVGLFLLILLAVFAGPGTFPRYVAPNIPVLDEGVPCTWLRQGFDRANHQSLIGRGVENPLSIRVSSSALPRDASGSLVIRIVVINESVGTVPFVYNPEQVVIGDDGLSSGIGLIVSPQTTLALGTRPPAGATIDEADIRLLGPRQRCIHRVELLATQLDATLAGGSATVQAFYRNNTAGQTLPTPGVPATPIFNDQGLWVGLIQSPAVNIALPGAAAGG